MVLLERRKKMSSLGRDRSRWEDNFETGFKKTNSRKLIEFVWLRMGTIGLWFHKMGRFLIYGKFSFLSTLLHITQPINTYIDPVCPDRLTLRYCSCNTYLLHRRAELKAAPGST